MKTGLGLRPKHYQAILKTKPKLDLIEAITEDFIHFNGDDFKYLKKISEHYPIALHGVALSIGGSDPLDQNYLRDVKKLAQIVNAISISDHFCWTGISGIKLHDLLPLPFTHETVKHISARVQYVQEFFGRIIMLENISSYITFKENEMTEWEFINAIAKQSGCHILLDVNNIVVNAFNHKFSAEKYLSNISHDHVKQFHIAGYKHCQTHIIDTHDHAISHDVWALFEKAKKLFPRVPVVLERDSRIPALSVLLKELTDV